MKLSQFTPEINKNRLTARVMAADNPNAYGADQSGSAMLGKSIGAGIDLAGKAWQQRLYDNVQDATNEYSQQINSLLYDENKGLAYTMQGKAAEGMEAAYRQEESKIRSQLMEKYHLDGDMAGRLFAKQIDPDVTRTLNNINKLQRTGRETYAEGQRVADTSNTVNALLQNPEDFTTIYDSYAGRMRANYASLGTDELTIDNTMKTVLNKTSQELLTQMAGSSDYKSMLDLIPKLRAKGADESILKKYEQAARNTQVVKTTGEDAASWIAGDPSILKLTPEEAWQKYSAAHPFKMPSKADGTALGAIGQTIASDLAAAGITGFDPMWGTAVAAHESGRGENAPGNNYFGYKWTGEGNYQDLATWERDANGNAYQTTARFQVYDSPEDSAHAYSKWLLENCSPEELKSIHSAGDLARVMKNHGYYTDDSGAYASSVDALAKEYSGEAGTSEEKTAAEEQRKNAFLDEFAKAEKARKAQIAQSMSDMQLELAKMQDGGESSSAMISYVTSYGDLHPEVKDDPRYYMLKASLSDRQRALSGSYAGRGGPGKASGAEVSRIGALINAGDIRNENELASAINQAGIIISGDQYDKLAKELSDLNSGKGFDILIGKEELARELYGDNEPISDITWGLAKQMTRQEAAAYFQQNHRWPTQQEATQMMKNFIVRNIDTGGQEVSAAELRAIGIQTITGTDSPDYRTVYFNDGSSYDVDTGDLQRLIKGEITEEDLAFQRQNGMMS